MAFSQNSVDWQGTPRFLLLIHFDYSCTESARTSINLTTPRVFFYHTWSILQDDIQGMIYCNVIFDAAASHIFCYYFVDTLVRRKDDQILAQRMRCHPPSVSKWKDNGHGMADSHDLGSNRPNASEEENQRLLSVFLDHIRSGRDLVASWDLALKGEQWGATIGRRVPQAVE